MRIVCIGAGYVGGPTMAIMADRCPGHTVTVVDVNEDRIAAWNSDSLPIFEPGLDEVVKKTRGRNLFFSTEKEKYVAEADMIFVAVNTPTKLTGIGAGKAADLTYWEGCARLIATCCKAGDKKVVVEKSTVPVRTADAIQRVLTKCAPEAEFQVLSNPEFLAEGTAINDLLKPDRVLIGHARSDAGAAACELLASVYAEWIPRERILKSSIWSAELAKLTANAMLAQRVSSINAMSAVCEATGADVQEIATSVGMDSRIGPKFLNASVGFGGSCFQKDILNLVYICETLNLKPVAEYWEQVLKINEFQKERFVDAIVATLFNTVRGKRIAVLGFAFKKNTGDTRESPAIAICKRLLDEGANIAVYDPQVSEQDIMTALAHASVHEWWDHPLAESVRAERNKSVRTHVNVVGDALSATKGAHAALVLTEWDEFKTVDWERAYELMEKPASVFDGRLILNRDALRKIGFVVHGLGKPLDPYVAEATGRPAVCQS
ncbi:unnamed protein product [Pedinophyceae sp. YPF-701]|nr:unnamed protein product [Pedinophyceae sp. YPF-701]